MMTTTTVDVQELPNRLAELLSLAAQGTEVIVMEGDVAKARLVPIPPEERIPGLHAGLIKIADDFDDPLPDEFWFGES